MKPEKAADKIEAVIVAMLGIPIDEPGKRKLLEFWELNEGQLADGEEALVWLIQCISQDEKYLRRVVGDAGAVTSEHLGELHKRRASVSGRAGSGPTRFCLADFDWA